MKFLAFAMIAACGGSTSNGDAGPDATTNDSSSNDATSDGQNNDASDGGQNNDAAGNDGSTCDGGCYACCAEQDPQAATRLFLAARTCGCTNPGDCQTVCAMSLCGMTVAKPDKACVECLLSPDAGNCGETAAASCADAGCGAVATCMEMCPP